MAEITNIKRNGENVAGNKLGDFVEFDKNLCQFTDHLNG